MSLRDYQLAALQRVRDEILQRARTRILLVAPTGAGKTVMAVELARAALSKGRRVLFVAHRKELIDQACLRLGAIPHGVIMAGRRTDPLMPVQVASIQTLSRRVAPPADLVIVDEAHRAAADSYRALLAQYPRSISVGLTATPWRTDGRGLADLFDSSVLVESPRALIEKGYLCHYRAWAWEVPDLRGVRTVAGDYDARGLEQVMSSARIVGNVVAEWVKAAPGPTVVFAVNRAHSRFLTAQFVAAGVAAEHVDGDSPDRDDIVARFRAGGFPVLCNCNILSEGFDLPDIACVVLARPTKSLAMYLQQVGRGLRPAPGKTLRIHDHAGCFSSMGTPDQERDYSLTGSKNTQPQALTVRVCPKCFAVYAPGPEACPACGYVRPVEVVPVPKSVEGVAVEYSSSSTAGPASVSRANEYLLALCEDAAKFGRKDTWVQLTFKRRFGFWPNRQLIEKARRHVESRDDSAAGHPAALGDRLPQGAPALPQLDRLRLGP